MRFTIAEQGRKELEQRRRVLSRLPPRLTDAKGIGSVLGTRKRGYTQCVLPQERIGHHVLHPVKAEGVLEHPLFPG